MVEALPRVALLQRASTSASGRPPRARAPTEQLGTYQEGRVLRVAARRGERGLGWQFGGQDARRRSAASTTAAAAAASSCRRRRLDHRNLTPQSDLLCVARCALCSPLLLRRARALTPSPLLACRVDSRLRASTPSPRTLRESPLARTLPVAAMDVQLERFGGKTASQCVRFPSLWSGVDRRGRLTVGSGVLPAGCRTTCCAWSSSPAFSEARSRPILRSTASSSRRRTSTAAWCSCGASASCGT